MRRIFWLSVGAGLGVAGAIYVARWTRRQRERLGPANLARQAAGVARDLGTLLAEAVEEFRKGMDEREAELRAGVPR